MPSTSKKQRRFMAAAAHNPRFAKKAGIKQSVAKDFHRADQGALKRAMGGSVRSSPMGERLQGGLGRATSRVPARSTPMRGNHRIRPETLSGTDSTISETGDGLRRIVGRISSRNRITAAKGGKVGSSGKAYAEGGKVGSAMSALRALAKKYQAAIDSGDTVLARRLKKQLDSAGVETEDTKVGEEKAKTFSKGGKVKGVSKLIRARMDDLEGYIREGVGRTRKDAYENLRKEVAHDNGEDVVDDLLKEHGVTYKRSKE